MGKTVLTYDQPSGTNWVRKSRAHCILRNVIIVIIIIIISYGENSLDLRPTWVTTSSLERIKYVSQGPTVYDKQHNHFCFHVTHEDIRSSLKMAHGCRNMYDPTYQIRSYITQCIVLLIISWCFELRNFDHPTQLFSFVFTGGKR
jgi:hypothetical protein